MQKIREWARDQAHSPESSTNAADGQAQPVAPDGQAGHHDASRVGQGVVPTRANGPISKGTKETSTTGEPAKPQEASLVTRFWLSLKKSILNSWINVLLVFVPVGIAVHFVDVDPSIVFAMNAIAIIPLAGLLSYATESVAHSLGDTLGALLNVSFGNAVELIIFIIALVKNEIRIVQASLLGSLLANLLLILGMCFLIGGLQYREQIYNSTVTQMSACLLCLSVLSLLLPTAFHASFNNSDAADKAVVKVSRGSAVILLLVYGLYLLFQLKSHSYMYQSTPQHIIDEESHPGILQRMNTSSSTSSSSSSSASSTSSRSTNRMRRIGRKLGRKRRPTITSTIEANSSNSPVETTQEPSVDSIEKCSIPEDLKAERRARRRSGDLPVDSTSNRPLSVPDMDYLAPIPQGQSAGDVRRPSAATRLSSMRPRPPPVFRTPLPAPEGDAYPLRRTRSLPIVPMGKTGSARIAGYAPYAAMPVNGDTGAQEVQREEAPLSQTASIVLLLSSTALVALCAEFLVGSINHMVNSTPLSEAFIGLIILPIVGNAAEHVTSVTVAAKNRMDLAIGVAVGSSIQIAIFITPVVVLLGWIMEKPMSLYFNLFETVSLLSAVFIVNFLVLDGRSNYLEGVLLCAAYIIVAVGAYFFPDAENQSSLTVGQEKRDLLAGMMGIGGSGLPSL